jgi:hypothetical protein
MLKRIVNISLCIALLFFLMGAIENQSVTIIYENTSTILNAEYKEVQRTLDTGTESILQTYFYLGADFTSGDFRIITGDDYQPESFSPATTLVHAQNSQALYDDYMIIGGVNADYFESYGVPQEAYIENGDVVSSGIGYAGRLVIGFKNDGTAVFGKPIFDGYEIVVKDSQGKERITLPIKHINVAYQEDPFDIYAYFDTFNTALPSGINKYNVVLDEFKGAVPKIFGRGVVDSVQSRQSFVVADDHMTIVTENPYIKELVETGDVITVHRRVVGDFSDVDWAVGVYGTLVQDGQKLDNITGIDPAYRNPRTAVGIKADGSVFFVAMDGRQSGYSLGATSYQMADLMLDYGAVDAFTFDGGGSTTMVTRTEDNDFEIQNSPSDGSARRVTNSIFLAVKVNFDNDLAHPIPDYSQPLNVPQNIEVSNGVVSWDQVDNKTSYEVMIDDQAYITQLAYLDLRKYIFNQGTYQIKIKAIGDQFYYSDSNYTYEYEFVYDGPIMLDTPSDFILSQGILYFDQLDPYEIYEFTVLGKSYDITINRFNLNTLSLEPGSYEIRVKKIGDGFNTLDSLEAVYTYRIYTAEELEIKDILSLVKDILYMD